MTQPPPLTELQAAAVQVHELYSAYCNAGFTPGQAMQLLCAIVTAGIQQQPPKDPT